MLTRIDRITYRNGFRINGIPATVGDVEPIFEGHRAATLSVWELYEQRKMELRQHNLTPEQYQAACSQIAEALGV